MEVAIKEFKKFIESNLRNSWIYGENISVYVRKSYRFVKDDDLTRFEECIDIATVEVDEEHQNKGIFSSFLNSIVNDYGTNNNIFIESIQNPIVEHICRKIGFDYVNPSEETRNMIHLKTL